MLHIKSFFSKIVSSPTPMIQIHSDKTLVNEASTTQTGMLQHKENSRSGFLKNSKTNREQSEDELRDRCQSEVEEK